MGLIRKVASVTTLGMVDFRSDKERQARYAKQSRDIQREQVKLDKKRNQEALPSPDSIAAGWYPDSAGVIRWWDGKRWTDHTQPSA